MGKFSHSVLLLCCALAMASGAALGVGDENAPKAFWLQGQIVAAVKPLPNEGYIQIARRMLEAPERYLEIAAFNNNRPLQKGRSVRIPLNLLKPEQRGNILRMLYPEDELTEKGWAHHVTNPLETLIQLTEAYTGSKRRFRALAQFNSLKNPNVLRAGTVITIPLKWIPGALGFQPKALRAPLGLLKDGASGRIFATYTLKKNETLYSVILRFTDRERADEVRRMASIMMRLNGIARENAVPAGRPLRMPVEWISEDYLAQKTAPRHKAPPPPVVRRPSPRYGPVHVIIDPGHGGVDPGAVYGKRGTKNRVYEHEVVYDIALRLSGLLNAKGYRTHLTVRDPVQAKPVRTVATSRLGREMVQVNPPYIISNNDVSVNMRVFLIDALLRRLTRRNKVAPENIILISIHGDALAPSLRGSMVYFPDHRLRVPEFRPKGRVYRLRKEAVPSIIRFTAKQGKDSHWASKRFGENIITALKAQGLRVGGRRPVRSYYYRNGERTLPAVLRYSRVPTSVLVEVGNLNNPADRRAILHSGTRQRIAKGLADAVQRYRGKGAAVALGKKAG
ncbi:MAG: N-acetylmuramoyl-L-alanine amidase [SAR324 cluster bacterium]|nr:N-acetylmuramoyl-L-alanine amidase [SAR324 cluster bacterium]